MDEERSSERDEASAVGGEGVADRGTPGPTRGEGMGDRGGNPRSTRRSRAMEEDSRLRQNQRGSVAHQQAVERQTTNRLLKPATVAELLGLRQEMNRGMTRIADRLEAMVLASKSLSATADEVGADEVGADESFVPTLRAVEWAFGFAFRAASDVIRNWRAEAEGVTEIVGDGDYSQTLARLRDWNANPGVPPLRAQCFPNSWVQGIVDSDGPNRAELLQELGFQLRTPAPEPAPQPLPESYS